MALSWLPGAHPGWKRAPVFFLTCALGAGLLAACGAPVRPGPVTSDGALAPAPAQDLAVSASQSVTPAALDRLAGRRVIFMGEVHNRPEHHSGQLAAIRALHGRGVDLALGLESFQRPAQPHLDDFAAGRIGEPELLRRTEYAKRWGFDYGLYREILEFARAHDIPLVALNAPSELVQRVSHGGLDAMPAQARRLLPTPPEPAQGAYRQRLVSAFGGHGSPGDASRQRLQRFLEVQMLWDETMALTAADYLAANPGKTLVILAGMVHVAYPDAIPRRLWRRYPVSQAWVFPDFDPHHPRGRGVAPSGAPGHPVPGA